MRGSNAQVYVGTHFSDHEVGSLPFMDKSDGYTIMGHSRAMNSNRVSYYFDFSGEQSVTMAVEPTPRIAYIGRLTPSWTR